MSKTMVNLTQHSILQGIERVLESYPDHPHQRAFAHPDLRQELVIWVLNRVPNLFTVYEETEVIVDPTYATYCSDAQSCTEFVIHQGIQELLIQQQSAIVQHIPEEESTDQPASHWFG